MQNFQANLMPHVDRLLTLEQHQKFELCLRRKIFTNNTFYKYRPLFFIDRISVVKNVFLNIIVKFTYLAAIALTAENLNL